MSSSDDSWRKRLEPTDETGRRRAILITGSASGMGLETARLFHSKGWYIVAVDNNVETTPDVNTKRPRPGLKELEAELKERIHTAKLDVADKAGFDALIAELREKLPKECGSEKAKLDLVFANAGIGRGGFWADQPWEDHLAVLNVNFLGVMTAIYCSLPLMRENPGSLVFSTSSSSAMYGMPMIATYSATKHAVKGLTEALSVELRSSGIRVADTLPGTINTALMPTESAERTKALPANSPFRLIEPSEIAQVVWKSYVDDPEGKDALGDSTHGRLHWYVPEELHVEIDSVVNTRGGAEKIREFYYSTMWAPAEERIKKAMAERKAQAEAK
ncbi:short-chain dehydrogenase/reductase SDR [Hyaloraphidium curvatum]|nr:short-chain dehydrogenase/reductase SDR [Hyaloraphidium curvatum]